MEQQQNLLSNDLQVDPALATHLKETAGWAKFLGILGFVAAGLIAIIAFVLPRYMYGSSYSRYSSYGSSVDTMVTGLVVVYLLVAVVVFFCGLFTFKFGNKVKQALLMSDQAALDNGMKNLKFLFRMQGIISILYIIMLLIGILQKGMSSY